MAQYDIDALQHEYDRLQNNERDKNALIEVLLQQVHQLRKDFHQEKLDHARESEYNRSVQRRELDMQDELRQYRSLMERDAFVLILIDGDGMIFEDELLQKGEDGGREAAADLTNKLKNQISIMDLPSDAKLVARIYANIKGLGEACSKAGIIARPYMMEDFARGFTSSKLFDFVDVGAGKDRADDKITEIFKLHLYDSHCRKIFFGCSHDNGYARLLEDVTEPPIVDSIILLEGVPFERELEKLRLKYQTLRLEGLFRNTKIGISQQNGHSYTALGPQPKGLGALTPSPNQYQSSRPLEQTWASTTSQAALLPEPPLSTSPSPSSDSVPIQRNRYHQRLDPALPPISPSDRTRIAKLKLCNVHFLRKDCPYDPCTHDHSYQATPTDLISLRHLSRMIPCRYGSQCDDVKCIHGHRCPNDVAGRAECNFGPHCKFVREMHGIDRIAVRTTQVGSK